mgnify:FL=1
MKNILINLKNNNKLIKLIGIFYVLFIALLPNLFFKSWEFAYLVFLPQLICLYFAIPIVYRLQKGSLEIKNLFILFILYLSYFFTLHSDLYLVKLIDYNNVISLYISALTHLIYPLLFASYLFLSFYYLFSIKYKNTQQSDLFDQVNLATPIKSSLFSIYVIYLFVFLVFPIFYIVPPVLHIIQIVFLDH